MKLILFQGGAHLGYYLAAPEDELKVAFQTIGPVLEKFVSVDPILEPKADGSANGVYITNVRFLTPQRRAEMATLNTRPLSVLRCYFPF